MDSPFNEIYPEDTNMYLETLLRYEGVGNMEGEELFTLKKISLVQADRWSEIKASAKRAKTFDNGEKIVITDLRDWAYRRYQILMAIHEDCRSMWRSLNEQANFFERKA